MSALPGSYSEVAGPLCFDAACNSQKVAAQRQAEREAQSKAATSTSGKSGTTQKHDAKTERAKPTNQTPPRLLQYRVGAWRKWVANALMMAQPERNGRVLIALCLAGRSADVRAPQYTEALARLTGNKPAASTFLAALEYASDLDAAHLARAGQAVAACAALFVDEAHLVALLNYLDIDETQHFQIDKAFLELFTTNELEALATEIGLKKAMGERYKAAREGKKDAFIRALLSVTGFAYQGAVPQFMRYPRKPIGPEPTNKATSATGGNGQEAIAQPEQADLLAAA